MNYGIKNAVSMFPVCMFESFSCPNPMILSAEVQAF